MKKLVDRRPKQNPGILDNFMLVSDKLTSRQTKALARLRGLLKYELKEKTNA